MAPAKTASRFSHQPVAAIAALNSPVRGLERRPTGKAIGCLHHPHRSAHGPSSSRLMLSTGAQPSVRGSGILIASTTTGAPR